jgi:hypothetical protein
MALGDHLGQHPIDNLKAHPLKKPAGFHQILPSILSPLGSRIRPIGSLIRTSGLADQARCLA